MRPSSAAAQTDLFNELSAPPTMRISNPCQGEVLELLARLLWEVARSPLTHAHHEGEIHDQTDR